MAPSNGSLRLGYLIKDPLSTWNLPVIVIEGSVVFFIFIIGIHKQEISSKVATEKAAPGESLFNQAFFGIHQVDKPFRNLQEIGTTLSLNIHNPELEIRFPICTDNSS